jgi:hypothetical protein
MRSVSRFINTCLAAALLFCHGVHAAQDRLINSLPVLPGENEAAPGYFSIDEQSAAVGYERNHEKGNAKVEEYLNLDPLLSLDYGILLTNTFGAGASLARQGDQSRLQVNAVFAPARRLRIHLAGEQSASGSPSDAGVRNGYSADIKRIWGKNSMLSDIGLGAYTMQADGAGYAGLSSADNADDAAIERVDGIMLDLGLRPSAGTRLALRREQGFLKRLMQDRYRRSASFAANHLSYSHYLRDCTRLQGSYVDGIDARGWDLNIAKDNWRIGMSRAVDAGRGDVALSVGITIPLDGRNRRNSDCGFDADSAPEFEPIVDAAIARPNEHRTDFLSGAMPGRMHE